MEISLCVVFRVYIGRSELKKGKICTQKKKKKTFSVVLDISFIPETFFCLKRPLQFSLTVQISLCRDSNH